MWFQNKSELYVSYACILFYLQMKLPLTQPTEKERNWVLALRKKTTNHQVFSHNTPENVLFPQITTLLRIYYVKYLCVILCAIFMLNVTETQ